jgi:hypothetical protein
VKLSECGVNLRLEIIIDFLRFFWDRSQDSGN